MLPQVGTALSWVFCVWFLTYTSCLYSISIYILLGTEVEVPADIFVETIADSLCSTEASVMYSTHS